MPNAAAVFLHASLGAAMRVQSLAYTESKLAGMQKKHRKGPAAASENMQAQQLNAARAALMAPGFLDEAVEQFQLADGKSPKAIQAALAYLEVSLCLN